LLLPQNDIRVVRSVHGPPFPNPLISAQRHLVHQRALVAELFASYASGTFRPAASSPFFVLRERQPSGPDAYVGQVSIGPDPGAARVSPINDQWEAWRSHGMLDMGAALNVAYHRRGVASAAVRVLLEDWAIPQMGATEIHASAYVSNVASVRLWEKHGFVEEKGMRGVVSVPEAKGGGEEENCLLVWRLKE
jgi:RimJ/RimL family protein N-acetyltransferase